MASPFAVFRRNQKIMLATVGIGAMVAFVFLDPVMRYVGGRTQAENPVVVETVYGDLTNRELDNLKFSRQLVDHFLQQLSAKATAKQIGQGQLDARLFESLANRQYQFWHGQLMGRSQQGAEQAAIETLVLSKRAEQMGMVISDQAINDLLKEITADSISAAELEETIRELRPSTSVSRLFESIRTEMLASEFSQLFIQTLRDIPPAQRFEYYSRLNRRAKAEVMPLVVADFADQVADPSDAEVKEFYEKYKNDYPDPESPEPGLKEPKRASFQYFRADVGQLTEAAKADVTEEEIQKYYEDNKTQFRVEDFDDEKPATGEPAKPGAEEGTEKPAAADEPKSDEDKSAEPAPDKPAESTEKPGPEPASEKPAAEKPAEPPTKENTDDSEPQSRRTTPPVPARLVSATLKADDEAASDDKSSEETSNDEPAPAEPAETEKPADEPASTDAASPQPDAEKPAASTEKPEPQPADEKPADENAAAEKSPEEPRYAPLEKVADTIRTTLARQKVEDRVREQFEALSAEMRRYTDELDIYITEKGTNPSAKPPKPLDFAELAKGKDVQALEFQSVTPDQAAEKDIGKSFRVIQNQRTNQSYTMPFVSFAFSERLPTYKSEVDQDNDNNVFLFWKTQEEPAYVPPLDQIRDKVVRAWKLVKARDLARKRAEEFAVQARALRNPLAELFGSQSKQKVTETGPFSWLTLGNVPSDPGARPRLSEVEGVDLAGEDFMKAVFALKPAGIGVAMNVPQNAVYVIRLVDFEPSMEELRDDFARANPSRYMAASGDDQRAIYDAWLADLNREAGVTWLRQADTRGAGDDDDGSF